MLDLDIASETIIIRAQKDTRERQFKGGVADGRDAVGCEIQFEESFGERMGRSRL